jgi:hypothetical protein
MNITTIANSIFGVETIDFDKKRLHNYDPKDKTFSMEISQTDLGTAPKILRIRNPKTNKSMDFTMYKRDMDSTGEDTYGYWYQSKDKQYKVLLIND